MMGLHPDSCQSLNPWIYIRYHLPFGPHCSDTQTQLGWHLLLGICFISGADKVQILGGAGCLKTRPKKSVCALRIHTNVITNLVGIKNKKGRVQKYDICQLVRYQ